MTLRSIDGDTRRNSHNTVRERADSNSLGRGVGGFARLVSLEPSHPTNPRSDLGMVPNLLPLPPGSPPSLFPLPNPSFSAHTPSSRLSPEPPPSPQLYFLLFPSWSCDAQPWSRRLTCLLSGCWSQGHVPLSRSVTEGPRGGGRPSTQPSPPTCGRHGATR